MLIGKEVMIVEGAHEYENGKVFKEDFKSYTIPFVEVHTRTRGGVFRKGKIAFVPAKYCVEFDAQELQDRELKKAADKYGADSKAYAKLLKAIEKSKDIPD